MYITFNIKKRLQSFKFLTENSLYWYYTKKYYKLNKVQSAHIGKNITKFGLNY